MSIIYVDGMDCAGKTAAIDIVAASVGAVRRHRVLSPNPFALAFNLYKLKYEWDSDMVTNALLRAIDYDIRHFCRYDENVIQESTLLVKGYAMRIVSGASGAVLSKFEGLLRDYPKFDKSFFLTTDYETRMERIRKRISCSCTLTSNDRLILDDYPRFEKIDSTMSSIMESAFQAQTVDTSRMSPQDVAAVINQFSSFNFEEVA